MVHTVVQCWIHISCRTSKHLLVDGMPRIDDSVEVSTAQHKAQLQMYSIVSGNWYLA